MEGAFNSNTNEYVTAIGLEINTSYQFPKEEIWFADSNLIESYDKTKVKDVTKIKVRFRKGNESVINWNGTEYSIAPHFFIPNKNRLGINLVPESKEHKLAKNWIYNRIKNKNLKFKYSSVKKPFEYENEISINDLEVDYNKIGIEVTAKNRKTQRADIIIPFKKYNELFGTGIVIEIQFSKQYERTTQKRNIEWAIKGYSISWLWFKNFKKVTDSIIELNEELIQLETNNSILKNFKEENEKDLRFLFQTLSREIDEKMYELNYPFCIGECKKCGQGYMTKKVGKYGSFYGCSNFSGGCKHVINIKND